MDDAAHALTLKVTLVTNNLRDFMWDKMAVNPQNIPIMQ
jgi:hypothetical protein